MTRAPVLLFMLLPLGRLVSKTAIYSLHKSVAGSVSRIPVLGGFCRLHLFECHVSFDHVLNAIANDGNHVAVVSHIGVIADSPMAGNHHGSSLGAEIGNDHVKQMIQRVEFTLN